MRLKPTTLVVLLLIFLLVAQTASLTVTSDVNTTMLTSETNDEDSFSVSARNGSSGAHRSRSTAQIASAMIPH